ncbi:MAG: type II toxin-antitoxin system RelE/ParE family toxin [Mariprofundaceae bacterium]
MHWTVETLNKAVDEELQVLDPVFKAKFLHIAEMLESFGPHQVREPYVKHLEDKLWEIRMKARPGIARAIYVTAKGQRIVVLHAFIKKTQKMPRATLELARQRMKEAGL